MEKTLYDIDRLEQMLEQSRKQLTEVEKAAYFAACNVLVQTMLTRWNDYKLSSILYIEGEMKDFLWHANVLLGFVRPIVPLEEHYIKGRMKLGNVRRDIQQKQVVRMREDRIEG